MTLNSVLPVAILAGGLATRLRPITETIPKALVPVNGRPFLAHQLELLFRNGFREVVLCIGYLGEQIIAEIGDGRAFGLKVNYSHDGPELKGTAGAIRKALPLLGEAFFVLYGDSYLEIDYKAVNDAYLTNTDRALMTVMDNKNGFERSNVIFENGIVVAYDKKSKSVGMDYIDYGLSAYAASLFRKTSEPDLSDVQHFLAKTGELRGFEVDVPYHEIGSHKGLAALEKHLINKQ